MFLNLKSNNLFFSNFIIFCQLCPYLLFLDSELKLHHPLSSHSDIHLSFLVFCLLGSVWYYLEGGPHPVQGSLPGQWHCNMPEYHCPHNMRLKKTFCGIWSPSLLQDYLKEYCLWLIVKWLEWLKHFLDTKIYQHNC